MSNCTYNPITVSGPIGMFHCPDCGEMVVAGLPHPKSDLLEDGDDLEFHLNLLERLRKTALANHLWNNHSQEATE